MNEPIPQQLVRRSRVEEITAYSKSELYRLIKAGKFPAPLPKENGERASYWLLSEVTAHVQERINRRNATQGGQQQAQTRAEGGRFGEQPGAQ